MEAKMAPDLPNKSDSIQGIRPDASYCSFIDLSFNCYKPNDIFYCLNLPDAEPDPDGARDPGAHAGGRLLLRPRGHGRRDRRNYGRRRGEKNTTNANQIIAILEFRRTFFLARKGLVAGLVTD